MRYCLNPVTIIDFRAFLKWQLKPQKRPGNFSVYKRAQHICQALLYIKI
jgi:hypothetical protein